MLAFREYKFAECDVVQAQETHGSEAFTLHKYKDLGRDVERVGEENQDPANAAKRRL
jgi:hypothetical protein